MEQEKYLLQMILTGVIAIIYIPLAILLGKLFGLSGVLIANAIVFALNYLCLKCNAINSSAKLQQGYGTNNHI